VHSPRLRLFGGVVTVYLEPRDAWIGAYVAEDYVYICPLPFLVVRIDRRLRPFNPLHHQPRSNAETNAAIIAKWDTYTNIERTSLTRSGWGPVAAAERRGNP
jgi:hypothetical protein